MISDLAWGSTADLTALLGDGHVSAAALLEAQLERIERVNPALNAIVTLDVDGAGQPAISLPAGLDVERLPIGIQLVAHRWRDAELLAVARAIEPVAGGFRRPPAFP